jgi:hypothetical protein
LAFSPKQAVLTGRLFYFQFRAASFLHDVETYVMLKLPWKSTAFSRALSCHSDYFGASAPVPRGYIKSKTAFARLL